MPNPNFINRLTSPGFKIGPFIVPHEVKNRNDDGACYIYFHPTHAPNVNVWIDRPQYGTIAPEFMTREQHERMTIALNDAIATAMGTTRFDMKWRERNWFLSGYQFEILAEFSYRSGKTIVNPQSFFGHTAHKGGAYISHDDIKFLEDQRIDIDLRPVIHKFQTETSQRHDRIRDAVVKLNHISGYHGWVASKTWVDGVVCLSLGTPFMMDYRDREGIESLYRESYGNLPANGGLHAYQNAFLDKPIMEKCLKSRHESEIVSAETPENRIKAYLELTAPIDALLRKIPEGTVDGGYAIYTNRFSFEISGTIEDIERRIRILQRYSDDFRNGVKDLVAKSSPSAILMNYTDRQAPILTMIEAPNGQVIPLWQIIGENHAAFMQSLQEIIDSFHHYIMHKASERKACLNDMDADIGAVDLTQKVTVREWLACQDNSALPRLARLSPFAREMLELYIPVCKDLIKNTDGLPATARKKFPVLGL